jgi:ribonuclease HII
MPPRSRTALLLGLDEAGYGPFLGPLCVGAAVFRAPLDDADKPPCLWETLSEAVCRSPKESTPGQPRLCVNDSKALKRSVKKGPDGHAAALADIELSLLAFMRLMSESPVLDDADLFGRLACATLHDDAKRDARSLPINHDPALVTLRATGLARVAQDAGIELHALRVSALDPERFNAECAKHGSKAAVTACMALARLRDLWGELASDEGDQAAHTPRLGYAFLDRQGGRTDYAAFLSSIDPRATIDTVRRGDTRSAYTLRDGQRELRVLVEVEADSKRFPVALASMVAKYARDLAMLRFNARFAIEHPEMKPTQGYGVDGRRWISDAARYLTAEQLRTIVRQR